MRTRGSALIPTWLAFAVTRLLEEHFATLVDYDFTASMEEDLDRIAGGEEQRVDWLRRFYFGDEATSVEGLRHLVDDLGEIDAREISTIPIGEGIVVRVGRYGPYVQIDGQSASIPEDAAPADFTIEQARNLGYSAQRLPGTLDPRQPVARDAPHAQPSRWRLRDGLRLTQHM